jgi:hypothetical protein
MKNNFTVLTINIKNMINWHYIKHNELNVLPELNKIVYVSLKSGEVEEALLEIEGISEVWVYGRKNAVMGQLVCCEIVSSNPSLDISSIKQHLAKRLQEFKIPRIIKFVEKLDTTRTGKLKRTSA